MSEIPWPRAAAGGGLLTTHRLADFERYVERDLEIGRNPRTVHLARDVDNIETGDIANGDCGPSENGADSVLDRVG